MRAPDRNRSAEAGTRFSRTPRARRRAGYVAIGLACSFVAAACGTTLDETTLRSVERGEFLERGSDGSVDGGASGGDATVPGMTGSDGGGTRVSTGGGPGTGSGAGSGTTRTTRGRGSGGGGGTNTTILGPPAARGFGFDERTVNLGFVYATNTDGAQTAFGVEGGEDSPHVAIAQALVDDINRRGGLAGRTAKLVEAPFNALTNSFSAEFEKVCQMLTADNKVVSAMTLFQPEPVSILTECLKRHGGVLALVVQSLYDQQEASRWWPHLYSPATMGFDRYAVMVDRAQRAGFFGSNAKVGVVYTENASVRRNVDRVVKPALERYGHTMVPAAMSPWTSNASSGLSQNSKESADALARFKDEGVQHVMFIGLGSRGPFVFHKAAVGQDYRAKYLYSSMESPTWQVEQMRGNTVADHQLEGALGVGWIPAWDIGETDGASTPGGKECFEVLRKANIVPNSEFPTVQMICEYFRFVEAVATEAGGFGAAHWGAAYPNVGSRLRPVLTYAITPRPGRFDGAAVARTMAYATDCHCWRYTGSFEPLP